MAQKVTDIIEKKKMMMLKEIKNRGTKNNGIKKKVNRATQNHEEKLIFTKTAFRKETAKLTDRLIPKIESFNEL